MKNKNKNKFFCSVCNITFSSEILYKKHLSSKTHFENLNNIKIDKINKPKKENTAHILDPFLDKEDVKKLEENFIGDSFKIQYKNNSFLNINFDKQEQTNPKLDNQNTENKKINELVKNKKLEKNINPENKVKIPEKKPEKIVVTQKQIKILQFLIKFQSHNDLNTKLYQILQSIEIKDLKGLLTHIISTNNINIKNKQNIIKIFKIFKQNLNKLKDKKITEYKNKSIDTLISLINI